MAEVQSLGVHTPLALPYLVAEGLLPADPKPDQYQWETYVARDGQHFVEEEILTTKTAVAWSQGKFIRNVYRFEHEGEDVLQALTTVFPTSAKIQSQTGTTTVVLGAGLKDSSSSKVSSAPYHEPATSPQAFSRAVVVFLKTKAHVFFLHGSCHIVDLPFEVERAFAAPRGLLLQRKRSAHLSQQPTPLVPAAPPNSFFSSQAPPGSSLRYSVSPTLVKSFAKTSFAHRKQPEPVLLGGHPKLNALFQDVISSPVGQEDDDVTNLYTLTDPLAELGVVTYSLQHHRSRTSGKNRPGTSIEFEGLDPAEQIIYVSSEDELSNLNQEGSNGGLVLLVTFNPDISTVSIWHAWYTDAQSLKTLLKMRADQKAAKARRRSSFMSANNGTGSATPAIRRRDGPRESFAAPSQLQAEPLASQTGTISRKPTRQEEEEAMALQMDPDFVPTGSQTATRENRRISSMTADVRASQTTVSASFAATAGRRATSFGGTHGRRSLSHRKSRGSTPGSAYGHSLGGDEDSMDLDSTIEFDSDESVDEILRHVRATIEASGVGSVFGAVDEGFKRELIVRKIHSLPVQSSTSRRSPTSARTPYKVVTLSEPLSYLENQGAKVRLYIHDSTTLKCQYITLKIRNRQLWSQANEDTTFAVPLLVEENRIDECDDIMKLNDEVLSAVLIGQGRIVLSLDEHKGLVLPTGTPYRFYDPRDSMIEHNNRDKEIGKHRTIDAPPLPISVRNAGLEAAFDEVTRDSTHHRRQLRLRPSSRVIDKLLSISEIILPRAQGRAVRRLWCTSYAWLNKHPGALRSTRCNIEEVAFATTTFLFAINLLDSKARAALNIAKIAAGNADSSGASHKRQLSFHKQNLSQRSAWSWMDKERPRSSHRSSKNGDSSRDHLLVIAAALADELYPSAMQGTEVSTATATMCAVRLMLGLHIMREENKLCTLSSSSKHRLDLAPFIAQLGSWLGLDEWSYGPFKYYDLEGASADVWSYVKSAVTDRPQIVPFEQPLSVFEWFEQSIKSASPQRYPDLYTVATIGSDNLLETRSAENVKIWTPRIAALSDVLTSTSGLRATPSKTVELLAEKGITSDMMETLPESMVAAFKESLTRCEKQPPTTWSEDLLQLVGRDDLIVSSIGNPSRTPAKTQHIIQSVTRDTQAVCHALDQAPVQSRTKEAGRHAVSQLIFSEDRRLVEATSLMHFNNVQIAQCPKQPEWDEAVHFEQQRRIMHWVIIRMIALPAGDGMIHYDSQTPLLTEKYHLNGFSSTCLMQPMGHTLTYDRSGLSEEKVSWAYFHAGVSAGLRISHNVKGIDTSWIAFNKPDTLTNRHAGLLLALGLGGHLRQLAKWLSFKYLTPKHTMTSVGLLLGLSASYLGTMDGLITRMLSVHITRMLPPGAAELNVSPATQTAGLMGIGLLYYNTQHRRMSEIMISEIEFMEVEDPDSGPDPLRDESYRLAAGFALGLINLGKGGDLQGLHGMHITERLLAVAIGPRPVSAVHVFDRATAGAVVAIALVFMKSGDAAIANKIDIPDTEAQFDQVRPDILMLRAMAKHIILWEQIEARGVRSGLPGWIEDNLPLCYKNRARQVMEHMLAKHTIDSAHIPLFNVYTGLSWALALKYAGSGNSLARDEILALLKFFHSLSEGADAYYFDGKLGRSSLRRCMDVLALCAATVMAGTGDLETFRYLRRMHGRADTDTPYGSHLAAHLAIGTLFLGGGTYTFSTSNLALASLICAFYPLFPTDVQDNRVHLQAFRHLWVLAAEARCIVFQDIDTQRPIHMPVRIVLRNGSVISDQRSPCLLPELDTISEIQTTDSTYWRVTLDFANNPTHLASFRQTQTIHVRRCPASEAHSSTFTSSLAALNTTSNPSNTQNNNIWHDIFTLPTFSSFDRADFELVLPPAESSRALDERCSVVDSEFVLRGKVESKDRDELMDLRGLMVWEERLRDGEEMRWLGREVVEELRAGVEERGRGTGESFHHSQSG